MKVIEKKDIKLSFRPALLSIILGFFSIILTFFIAYYTYINSRENAEQIYHKHYLEKAKILALSAELVRNLTDDKVLKLIVNIWKDSGIKPQDEYICIVDKKSDLILHTLHPETIGKSAGKNKILDVKNNEKCMLMNVVESETDIVGRYVSSGGNKQIAAFAFLPHKNWTIGIHRNLKALQAEVKGIFSLSLTGFWVIGLFVIPLTIIIVIFTFLTYRNQITQSGNDLKISEKKYKQISENSPAIVFQFRMSPEGSFSFPYINDNVQFIMGIPAEEVVKDSFKLLDMVHPEDQLLFQENILKSAETLSQYKQIIRYLKDGEEKWIEANSTPNRIDDGSILWNGFFTECTERIKSKEALEASEQKNRLWLENSPVCTKILDLDFNLKYMSASGINGLKIDDINKFYEKPYPLSFFPDSFKVVMRRNLEKVKRAKKKITYEAPLVDLKGNEIWFNSTLVPVSDEKGDLDYIMVVSIETTKRVHAERALIENEKKYRTLFERESDAVFIFDPETSNILEANTATSKMYGYDNDELIGMPCLRFSADIKKSTSTIEKIGRDGFANIQSRSHRKKDGTIFPVDLSAYNITLAGKEMMYAICKDITKQKIAENERKKLEDQLQQAQKMEAIGTLAGGIAHDFNNILGVIMGYSDLALDDPSDTKNVVIYMERVMSASKRAKDMVGQILAFSRKDEQIMKSVDIGKLVKETISFLRSSIPTTIEISSSIDKELDLIFGSETQINQVLMNLCTNAAHAMKKEGGLMKIALNAVVLDTDEALFMNLEPGSYQHLSVSDTGTGIKKNVIDRIFEPYFTTKKAGEGTGMGLAVTYGIVKSHGGTIKVYSELGTGTVFNIYFPVMGSRIKENISIQEKAVFSENKERILFVDDEIQLAELGAEMLEKLEYNVEKSTSSIEALEAFKVTPDKFDMIITDMTMPNMTGVKLAAEIHKIRPDIPVILCTGFSNGINKTNHLEKGISALVMKPITKSELSKVIRDILDKNQ